MVSESDSTIIFRKIFHWLFLTISDRLVVFSRDNKWQSVVCVCCVCLCCGAQGFLKRERACPVQMKSFTPVISAAPAMPVSTVRFQVSELFLLISPVKWFHKLQPHLLIFWTRVKARWEIKICGIWHRTNTNKHLFLHHNLKLFCVQVEKWKRVK